MKIQGRRLREWERYRSMNENILICGELIGTGESWNEWPRSSIPRIQKSFCSFWIFVIFFTGLGLLTLRFLYAFNIGWVGPKGREPLRVPTSLRSSTPICINRIVIFIYRLSPPWKHPNNFLFSRENENRFSQEIILPLWAFNFIPHGFFLLIPRFFCLDDRTIQVLEFFELPFYRVHMSNSFKLLSFPDLIIFML